MLGYGTLKKFTLSIYFFNEPTKVKHDITLGSDFSSEEVCVLMEFMKGKLLVRRYVGQK